MPRQNRVTPFGTFESATARGRLMGNRGILHDRTGVLQTRRWAHKHWIACKLTFKSRRRDIMAPHRYTELFFCDEAVALAAGHRPCAECRRDDFVRYRTAWQEGTGGRTQPKAADMDFILHSRRVASHGRQARLRASLGGLPDGTMVIVDGDGSKAWLVWRDSLREWTHEGYTAARRIDPGMEVIVLTPEPTVEALRAGYVPEVHSSGTI
jgi:hypothetical protein